LDKKVKILKRKSRKK